MGKVKWTEESIREIAGAYASRTEMGKRMRGAYRVALSIPGLLDELYGSRKFVWTMDALIDEAGKYESKSAFSAGSGGAYVACHTRFPGLLDTLFANKIKYWKTEESVLDEAKKYASRHAFKLGCSGAYKAAVHKFPNVLFDVFGDPLVRKWGIEELLHKAKQYESRSEFRLSAGGAYASMCKFGKEMDKVFPPKYRYWGNEVDIRAEAARYRTKSEFVYGCNSAYGAALSMGIIDDLGFTPGLSGFDTTKPAHLYVADLFLTDGAPGTLFGITNRRPEVRYTTAEKVFMTKRVSFIFNNGAAALSIETMLRRSYGQYTVVTGQSPLLDKKGTAGEILTGVPSVEVISMVKANCSLEPVPW